MNQVRHRLFLVLAATVFVVSAAFQVSLALRHPRWFKGNLHAHSNRNEGDVSPAEVARWYKDHDYQFLALSDHNLMTDPTARAEEVSGRFLVLNATELSGYAAIHVNAVAPVRPVAARPGVSRRGFLFDNVEAVRESGGVPLVNHPRRAELTFNELMYLDGEFLFEINDRVRDLTLPADSASPEALWDRLLSAGRDVYAVASDDARYFQTPRDAEVPGTGWIAVRAAGLNRDAIAAAIRQGDFYASTGIALDDVQWNGRDVRVPIHGVAGGRYKTTFLGAGLRVLSVTLANPAVYTPSPGDGYVRAHVEDQEGRSAWTQAIRLPVELPANATTGFTEADLSRQIASALDRTPRDGPVNRVSPFEGWRVGCDQPPDNGAAAGERMLSARRAIRGGAYEHARDRWVLTRFPSADPETIAREVRAAYRTVIQQHLPKRTVTSVEVRPMVLAYPAGYAGGPSPVSVRVKAIALETLDARGRRGTLTAYYVNYDKDPGPEANKARPSNGGGRRSRVVLVSTPHVPAEAVLGLGGESPFAGAAGKLAVGGLPLLLYDSTGTGASSRPEEWEHGLYLEAADVQLLDSTLLGVFDRVDLVGSSEALVHLLASHRARLASAYLVHFIPLWTRNDVAPRTGGPFGTDENVDHVVFQTQFQWADFLLAGVRDGVDLALASNAGSSGLGKAGLLYEIVPALGRHTSAFAIRGDDQDGDGFSRSRPPVCGGFDPADVQAFLERNKGR